VVIVCPAPAGSRLGNRITAVRWRELLSELGHDVRVAVDVPRAGYDVLVALHAFKTADVVRWSRVAHPERPVVVALTGTDLYRDIRVRPEARESLRLADRLVTLHDRAATDVPHSLRHKVRLIRQSARPVRAAGAAASTTRARIGSSFEVALVAHLRPEKDPLRAALAARLLPATSRLRLLHAGRALDDELRRRVQREQAANPRYRWLGELAPSYARRLIARSAAMVLTSRIEGGANVLGEAVVSGTPVLASRIPATLSALGEDYPGLFAVGDTKGLAALLDRTERDSRFRAELSRAVRRRRPLFARSAERSAWRSLLAELTAQTRRS
jgi:putative glycosyltransferase (TIGR04348 family)